MITVPESVAFYWSDAINMTAINVLAKRADVPLDLSLEEAERYELASLASQRVRVEFWQLLRALWSATWGYAVQSELPEGRLLSYGEHVAFADEIDFHAAPTVGYAWTEQATSGVYDLPGHGRLFTRFCLFERSRDREAQLQFYLYRPNGDVSTSDALDLGLDWTDDGESRRVTRQGVVPLKDHDHGIDSERPATLAKVALAALSTALR